MLGFATNGKPNSRHHFWTEAETKNLQAISSKVKDWLLAQEEYEKHPDQRYRVELAVVEACTNIMRHAYKKDSGEKKLGISMKRLGHEIEILVLDQGIPFDPTRIPPPELDEPREGGYGVFLIHQIMHTVSYNRRGTLWNVLRLTHPIPAPQGEAHGMKQGTHQNPGCPERSKGSGVL